MKPDATKHNPDPDYLRSLIHQSGLSQVECARLMGIDDSTIRRYLSGARSIPYLVQFAAESLTE